MNEYPEYASQRIVGAGPVEMYRSAKADGLGEIDSIRMLRSVFGMSLAEAKEVTLIASGTAGSLKEHELRVADELSKSAL